MRRLSLSVPVTALSFALIMTLPAAMPAQEPASTRIKLTRDSVVGAVHCAPTGKAYAVIHPNGIVDECPLARDTVIDGHALPRGTWIQLNPDAMLTAAWLPRDVELQGLPCKGTGYKGWSVRFHADGHLALCFLSRDAEIDSVPCLGGSFLRELRGSTHVTLDATGRLRSCRLSRAATIDGRAYPKGARINRGGS
ncbi:MAG: hypothetical protein IT357_04870 [Gemmatimonadaceae bacterium]|nr:hypothetical protein [Gemmatimonadaceae bacterium]